MQSMLGGLFLAAWALLSNMLFDQDLIHVMATNLPYLVVYELGIFSRYIPGLKTVAKRLE